MQITQQQAKEIAELARPLMDWLRKHAHPHVQIVVDDDRCSVTEELAMAYRVEAKEPKK